MFKQCSCGSGLGRRPLNDARGIFCAYVCDECEAEHRKRFRPEIFTDASYQAG
jgi:ribose 5-phosphate isomerase RpiB